MKFNHLNVPTHWQHYWTRYPEGHTILEALISWVSQVDSMVDNQNKLNTNVEQFRNEIDAFVERFDERLQDEVTHTLNDWQTSGFLDVVISEALQWELDDYKATNEQDKVSINQQLAQINEVSINPKTFGVQFDGTDESAALQTVIDMVSENGGGEILLTETISIANTVHIKENVTIHAHNATIDILEDVDGIKLGKNSKIRGVLRVNVPQTSYTSSAVVMDGSKNLYQDVAIEELHIEGKHQGGMGVGLHYDCSAEGSTVTFTRVDKLVVRGFEKAVFMDAPSLGGDRFNYINGNNIHTFIASDCDYTLYITGNRKSVDRNQVDGNIITNVQIQRSGRSKEVFHVESHGNFISGVVWDMKGNIIANFTETSRNNTLIVPNVEERASYINTGQENTIQFGTHSEQYIPVKDNISYKTPEIQGYKADYEDILHKADITATLNELTPTVVVSGSLAHAFDATRPYPLSLALPNNQQYSFEIVFNKGHIGGVSTYLQGGFKNLGFFFPYNHTPNEIRLEVTDHTGTITTTTTDLTYEYHKPAIIIEGDSLNNLTKHISKIKITFIGQMNTDVRLGRVFANSNTVPGQRFLSNGNSKVAGNIEFISTSNGFILPSADGSRFFFRVGNDGVMSSTKL